jgi:hypothetical protein
MLYSKDFARRLKSKMGRGIRWRRTNLLPMKKKPRSSKRLPRANPNISNKTISTSLKYLRIMKNSEARIKS